MLLLADGFYSYALWREAIGTGADLLCRAKTGLRPEHMQTLDDDSWLAQIRPSGHEKAEPITVRVIDFTIDDGRETSESYRLFTTIVDPAAASATELASSHYPALGDRARLRRTEDPPTRTSHRAEVEVPLSWYGRRSGDTRAVTLRSRSLMTTPPSTSATTRTGSVSSLRSGSPASGWRTRALFPADDSPQTYVAG